MLGRHAGHHDSFFFYISARLSHAHLVDVANVVSLVREQHRPHVVGRVFASRQRNRRGCLLGPTFGQSGSPLYDLGLVDVFQNEASSLFTSLLFSQKFDEGKFLRDGVLLS